MLLALLRLYHMSKKIKELADKAGVTIDGMGYGEGYVEKFANLIILECAKVAQDERDAPTLNYRPSVKTAEAIKRHFGL
jgi:hypothetical protein